MGHINTWKAAIGIGFGALLIGTTSRADPVAPAPSGDSSGAIYPEPADAQAVLDEAFKLYDSRDYATAAKLFLDADFPVSKTWAADATMRTGDLEHAEDLAREAVGDYPEQALPHSVLADILLRSRQYDEALVEAETAYAIDPADPVTEADLGTLVYLAGDFDRSRALTEHLLEVDTQPGAISKDLINLAELDEIAGHLERAETELNASVEATPDGPDALYETAFLYEISGRTSDAHWMARQAALLDPQNKTLSHFYFVWPELRLTREGLDAEARGQTQLAIQKWSALLDIEQRGALRFAPLAGHAAAHLTTLTRAPTTAAPVEAPTPASVTQAAVPAGPEVAKVEEQPALASD